MDKNEVYVTTDLDDSRLWSRQLRLGNIHWVNGEPVDQQVLVRTRHRGTLIIGKIKEVNRKNQTTLIELKDEVRASTPGQSAVLYQDNRVVGGGVIC